MMKNTELVEVVSLRRTPLSASLVWRLTSVLVALVATVSLFIAPRLSADASDQLPQPVLPIMDVLIEGTPLRVELASSSQQRYMGLSFRKSMPDDAGMLFVYQAEQPLTFTMRNTLIPLSIAFISKDLVINEIHDMDVGPNQFFKSVQTAQYALEVNQGWFERHGIKAGARLVLP